MRVLGSVDISAICSVRNAGWFIRLRREIIKCQHGLVIVGSLFGLVLLSPLFLLLAVLIKADSAGPVFYRAQRVGKEGKLFRQYKFRSMVDCAAQHGPGITTAGDERITRVGRLMRRSKLDELPQLLNVLKGEMDLVGPRPEDPRYVALYTPEQRRLLAVRPGITSPASLRYRHEEHLLEGPDWEAVYVEQVMSHKLQIELDYMERRTISSDLRVILETVQALIRQR
jgi:lipopolysaccharide/colanic/teichoic acid biosynthesis glycosyltransferase